MKILPVITENLVDFERSVNHWLAEGWKIRDIGPRQLGPQQWKMYALLEMQEPERTTDPVLDAMRTVQDACQRHCNGCRLRPYCKCEAPEGWKLPK